MTRKILCNVFFRDQICRLFPNLIKTTFLFFTPAIQVRLVNGSSDRQGRVEVFYNGEWGTVCNHHFDKRGAEVICRMMGYPGALSAEVNGSFGAGNSSQKILLDDLWCSGHETSVASCSFRRWGSHNCGHDEDAGVVCKKKFTGKF